MKNEIISDPCLKKTIIGDACIYVCKTYITSGITYTESTSVSGDMFISNDSAKLTKAVLSAKVYTGKSSAEQDMSQIVYLDNAIKDGNSFDIVVGDIVFENSRIICMKAESSIKNGFVSAEITIATPEKLKKIVQ